MENPPVNRFCVMIGFLKTSPHFGHEIFLQDKRIHLGFNV